MNFDWGSFWHYLLRPSAVYLNGLWLTLSISVISQSLGTVLGLFCALARISKLAALRGPARTFIWAFRGTPLLVQIVLGRGLRRDDLGEVRHDGERLALRGPAGTGSGGGPRWWPLAFCQACTLC